MSRLGSYRGLGAPQWQVENLSTASTALTLTDDQQGKLLIWNANAGAARINLPAPEAGMTFTIYFHEDAVSSGTKIIANNAGTFDFYLIDGTTGVAFAPADASTIEGGIGVTVTALNGLQWIVDKWGASTRAFAVTNGSTTT